MKRKTLHDISRKLKVLTMQRKLIIYQRHAGISEYAEKPSINGNGPMKHTGKKP